MRRLVKLAVLALAALGGRTLYEKWKATQSASPSSGTSPSRMSPPAGPPRGQDTPTGTDPNAKWSRPGFEDKSIGQAVNQDQQLVDELVDETGGDLQAAEDRFKERSAGAPALARQDNERSS
jgi:hypothetical protein